MLPSWSDTCPFGEILPKGPSEALRTDSSEILLGSPSYWLKSCFPKETSEGPFRVQIFRGITIVPHSLFCCFQQQNEEDMRWDGSHVSKVSFRMILPNSRRFAFYILVINRTHRFRNFTRPCIFPVNHLLSAEISF